MAQAQPQSTMPSCSPTTHVPELLPEFSRVCASLTFLSLPLVLLFPFYFVLNSPSSIDKSTQDKLYERRSKIRNSFGQHGSDNHPCRPSTRQPCNRSTQLCLGLEVYTTGTWYVRFTRTSFHPIPCLPHPTPSFVFAIIPLPLRPFF